MPVHLYKAEAYVTDMLQRIGVQASEEHVRKLTEVLRANIGLNPRAPKRHVNTLLLLINVAEQSAKLRSEVKQAHRPLVMLALTAMEARFPELHRWLSRALANESRREEVENLIIARQLPEGLPWVQGWLDETSEDGPAIKPPMAAFLQAFGALVDDNNDGELSDEELTVLQRMMLHSAISSVSTDHAESPSGLRAEFAAVVQAYLALPDPPLPPRGKGRGYRQFRNEPDGWPNSLHYELMDGVRVSAEIHVEGDDGLAARPVLEALGAELDGSFPRATVEFSPKWSKGRGRLRVLHEPSTEPRQVAENLAALIRQTREPISRALRVGLPA